MSDEEIISVFKNMIINFSIFLFSLLLFFNPALLTQVFLFISIYVVIKSSYLLFSNLGQSLTEQPQTVEIIVDEKPIVNNIPEPAPLINVLKRENETLKDRVRKLRKDVMRLKSQNIISSLRKPVSPVFQLKSKKIDVVFDDEDNKSVNINNEDKENKKDKEDLESIPESLPELISDEDENYVVS